MKRMWKRRCSRLRFDVERIYIYIYIYILYMDIFAFSICQSMCLFWG